jgi:SWI/SNF-related matrix-associated actin-dependent regulator of chromatin subfamily A3
VQLSLTHSLRVEDALEMAGIRYDRLDGTMRRDERSRAMDALKYDPACEVLLVSLKAGGVGLNLTAAQRVYLMDPYWYATVFAHVPTSFRF